MIRFVTFGFFCPLYDFYPNCPPPQRGTGDYVFSGVRPYVPFLVHAISQEPFDQLWSYLMPICICVNRRHQSSLVILLEKLQRVWWPSRHFQGHSEIIDIKHRNHCQRDISRTLWLMLIILDANIYLGNPETPVEFGDLHAIFKVTAE